MDNILATSRLTLAPHTLADFDDLHALWSDARVTVFLGGKPSTREENWQRLQRCAGSWALLGYGFWAVREAATGAYVGDIGFLDGKRTGVEGFDGDPEIGWSINVAHHGKGYASEAVRAALGWGDAHGFRRCVAIINPGNTASIHVAERTGFAPFGTGEYKEHPIVLWERLKP